MSLFPPVPPGASAPGEALSRKGRGLSPFRPLVEEGEDVGHDVPRAPPVLILAPMLPEEEGGVRVSEQLGEHWRGRSCPTLR